MSSPAPGWIHMRIDQIMSSGAPSWIQESIQEWPPEIQAGFISNLLIFQLRINQMKRSRAPGWIHIKFDNFSTENH